MAWKVYPNEWRERLMRERQQRMLSLAAQEAAGYLELRLSSTSGTGIHWAGLPHRSSAPGEYPVRQFGDLMRGVGHDPAPEYAGPAIVYIKGEMGKLAGLEFAPPSPNPNTPPGGLRAKGGRGMMWMHFTDPDTHEAMGVAMERLI